VSTPPFLDLPDHSRPYRLGTSRGQFAVVDVAPRPGTPRRATAVLVPGFTGSKEDFIAVLEPLAARGHRVLAFDQRGQFETPGPDEPEAYRVDELAADLHAVLAALGDGPVHLVGHSLGGFVARAAVLGEGQGEWRGVRTLMSSGPAAVGGQQAQRLALLEPVLREAGMAGLWQAIRALDEADGVEGPPPGPVGEFLARRFHANAPAGLVGMAAALLSEPDRVDDLARLPVPVHVTHGPDDDVWPSGEQEEMARRLAAPLSRIPGAGHSPAAEAPAATASVLAEFWASCEEPARGVASA